MSFFSTLFGGPSAQQNQLASQESSLAATMSAAFNQQLAGQSQILQNLNSQLTPIASLGPNQQGFSAPELAAMNTQAINSVGAAARNAQQSVGTTLAGQGNGGGSGLESGIQEAIKGSVASSAANELAGAQNDITQANYATGRQNFFNAVNGEQALAKAYNPEAFGGLASSTNQAALQDANQIQTEKQQGLNSLIGLGKGILTGGTSFITGGLDNLDSTGNSSIGEQGKNFFSGGIAALAGQ